MSIATSAVPNQIKADDDMSINIPQFINFEEVRELFHDLPIEIAMYDIKGNYEFVNKWYASDENIRKNLIGRDDDYLFNIMSGSQKNYTCPSRNERFIISAISARCIVIPKLKKLRMYCLLAIT
jgi:hypothetical protein